MLLEKENGAGTLPGGLASISDSLAWSSCSRTPKGWCTWLCPWRASEWPQLSSQSQFWLLCFVGCSSHEYMHFLSSSSLPTSQAKNFSKTNASAGRWHSRRTYCEKSPGIFRTSSKAREAGMECTVEEVSDGTVCAGGRDLDTAERTWDLFLFF